MDFFGCCKNKNWDLIRISRIEEKKRRREGVGGINWIDEDLRELNERLKMEIFGPPCHTK